MKITHLSEKYKFPGLEENNSKIMNEVVNSAIATINKAIEEKILQSLKMTGFDFSSKEEFYDFAKKRCVVLRNPGSTINNLFVKPDKDGIKWICSWDENPIIVTENNNFKFEIQFKFPLDDQLKSNIIRHE